MLTLKFKDVGAAKKYGITVDDIVQGFHKAIGKSGTVTYNHVRDIIFVQIGAGCENSKDNICLPVELTADDGKNIAKNKKEIFE